MDAKASPVTSITATILAKVTKDRCPSAESRRSATSTRTKLGTGEATSLLMPATTRTRSTAPDIRRENPAANTVKEWFNEVDGEPHFAGKGVIAGKGVRYLFPRETGTGTRGKPGQAPYFRFTDIVASAAFHQGLGIGN
jgi:hypothetical protein